MLHHVMWTANPVIQRTASHHQPNWQMLIVRVNYYAVVFVLTCNSRQGAFQELSQDFLTNFATCRLKQFSLQPEYSTLSFSSQFICICLLIIFKLMFSCPVFPKAFFFSTLIANVLCHMFKPSKALYSSYHKGNWLVCSVL